MDKKFLDYTGLQKLLDKFSDIFLKKGSLATPESDGVMSAADKTKLDSIDSNINDKVSKIEDDLYDEVIDLKVGDVILADNETEELAACNVDNLGLFKDTHTPIGVVVIPTSHDVYGTGEAGVMSLLDMSCNTPNRGSNTNEKMYWGVKGEQLTPGELLYVGVPMIDNIEDIGKDHIRLVGSSKIPSDYFGGTGIICYHDINSYYGSSSGYKGVSPYLTDGSRNIDYYEVFNTSNQKDILGDFDGINNTDMILNKRGIKDYNNWKPVADSDIDYPATSCCDMFYTKGTHRGNWYLPACGELGYVISRYTKIKPSLQKIIDIKSSDFAALLPVENFYGSNYISSSEASAAAAMYIRFNDGDTDSGNKNSSYLVRAFTRIKLLKSSKFYTKEEVDDKLSNIDDKTLTKITYSDLKELRDNSKLTPGCWYQITDYQCTTTQENTRAKNNQFDILIFATSENTLSEECRAVKHEGDTYFENCNLEAWKIWYTLDNDYKRFYWADEENGKGVIYRMIDEWNNDIPYDFKNIQFIRSKIEVDNYDGSGDNMSIYFSPNKLDDYIYVYTFSIIENKESFDYYTDPKYFNVNHQKGTGYNIVKPTRFRIYDDNEDSILTHLLNNIVFSIEHYHAITEPDFYGSRFPGYNIIELDCNDITIGYGCHFNRIGPESNHISLFFACEHNNIGGLTRRITLTNSDNSIIYGDCFNINMVEVNKTFIYQDINTINIDHLFGKKLYNQNGEVIMCDI